MVQARDCKSPYVGSIPTATSDPVPATFTLRGEAFTSTPAGDPRAATARASVALDGRWHDKVKGRILWRQVKKKDVLDFSKWKTKAFERQYAELLNGMKIYYPPTGGP